MTKRYNPSLREEPRNKPIKVTPFTAQEPLLGWLERTGRLKPREVDELKDHRVSEDLDDIVEPDNSLLKMEEEQLN